MIMTHFNNSIAAHLNARDCRKQGRNHEADRYNEMAQTFCRWHVKEVGGTYLGAYITIKRASLEAHLDKEAV
tara:strand:+ start:32 stop:247 length:216 start_codon:yes stop_codon:yes gene_type:complete